MNSRKFFQFDMSDSSSIQKHIQSIMDVGIIPYYIDNSSDITTLSEEYIRYSMFDYICIIYGTSMSDDMDNIDSILYLEFHDDLCDSRDLKIKFITNIESRVCIMLIQYVLDSLDKSFGNEISRITIEFSEENINKHLESELFSLGFLTEVNFQGDTQFMKILGRIL